MSGPLVASGAFVALILSVGGWLGWQLLRQNGRLLLRLEELEKRLDELEFGERSGGPEGLAVGSEAPAFELPDLSGEIRTLAQYRGQPLLLIFFNPACGFCRELAPKLERLQKVAGSTERVEKQRAVTGNGSADARPEILIISTGGEQANRQFFEEHKVAYPVLLQKETEVAAVYKANGTPTGYLIDPEGRIASELAIGAESLLALAKGRSEIGNRKSEMDQSLLTSAATTGNRNGRESRFRNRSLAHSKIKRDGLKAGTPAPDFRLPRLDGRGDLALSDLRGRRVLLVFSSPNCGPCNTLAPELERFHRQHPELEVVMVTKGEPKENRGKVKKHSLTFPIVLQQQWEISLRYAMFATPIAYLIDEEGVILRDVAVGTDAILGLLAEVRELSEGANRLASGEGCSPAVHSGATT